MVHYRDIHQMATLIYIRLDVDWAINISLWRTPCIDYMAISYFGHQLITQSAMSDDKFTKLYRRNW